MVFVEVNTTNITFGEGLKLFRAYTHVLTNAAMEIHIHYKQPEIRTSERNYIN